MKTIICVASGPSLTESDCELVSSSGITTIAVNSSWERIPMAEHVYAGDFQWWQANEGLIPTSMTRWSSSKTTSSQYGVRFFESPISGSFNSGQRAILLARKLGAEKIILLGYDCSIANGIHWHKDHGDGLKNPDGKSVTRWKREFTELTRYVPAHIIINCSRHTELNLFQRADLQEQLDLCKSTSLRG